MNPIKNIFRSILVALFLLPLITSAQNNTSSPYSKFGVGDLSNVAYGRSLGLGGAGFGLRDANFLNIKNPASLTSIDTLSTLFEMGVFGKLTQNSSIELNQYNWDANITHVLLGHRYTSWLMGSYGLMPFSDIGYNFRTFGAVEGDVSPVITDWSGSGGISKLFYGLGLKVNKNFSLGADVAYYYGPINERRKTTAMVEPGNSTYMLTNTRYSGVSIKGAFQFNAKLDKKGSAITLGGVISPEQKFTGISSVNIEQYYNTSEVARVYSKESYTSPINIPVNYGFGGALNWQNKYLLAVDYESSLWSNNNSREYIDQSIYSFGIERLSQTSLKYYNRCSYRLGFRYDSGYFTAKGQAVDDMRLTMGVGLPVKKTRSSLNISLEAGQRGSIQSGLLRERYTKLTVAFSFHDYWFVKRKID